MSEIDRSIVQSNNQFAIDLYQELRKTPGNLVFSPYSISTALAMAYAGARSTTAAQIAEVMHFPPDQAQIHSSY